MKTDRETDELLGPVRTVRTYVTKLPAKMRRAPSSGQTLRKMLTYDVDGRKIEEVGYREDDTPYSRSEYVYDEGRHTETLTFDMGGSLKSRNLYSYSADGSEQEKLLYQADGTLSMRAIRRRDDRGNTREEIMYLGDGRLMSKMVMSYDDKGREIEAAICHESSVQPAVRFEQDEEGRRHAIEEGEIKLSRSEECGDDSFLAGKVMFAYDESGNMLEIAAYAAGSSLPEMRTVMTYEGQAVYDQTVYKSGELLESKERIEREFDEHGNWVKETISSWVPSAGETEPGELEPTEIHHRTITYY